MSASDTVTGAGDHGEHRRRGRGGSKARERGAAPDPATEHSDERGAPRLEDVLAASGDPSTTQAEDHLETGEMDALLLQLRALRERIDRPASLIASAFVQARAWRALGHARQEDYSRNRLQTTARWLRQTADLGDALKRFPALDRAFSGEDGGPRLGKVAAVLIAGIATEQTLPLWIERARRVSVRQLKADVKRAREEDVLKDAPERSDTDEHRSHAPPREGERPPAEDPEVEKEGATKELPSDKRREPVPTVDVVVSCPPAVRAAFDETLDLHRAVCGGEANLASFAEALVAEAGTGVDGPPERTERDEDEAWDKGALRDPDMRRRHRPYPEWMEETDAETRAQRCREEEHPAAPLLRDVAELETDVFRLERDASATAGRFSRPGEERSPWDHPDAMDLHDHLLAAGSLDLAIERTMARLLAALQRARPWGRSGVTGGEAPDRDEAPTWATHLTQYAQERLGMSGSRARDLARVARRLRRFPVLEAGWTEGLLATDKLLVLLPLLGEGPIDPSEEEVWLEHARHVTIRRLRDEVRELRRRGAPVRRRSDPPPAPMADEEWLRSLRRQPGRTLERVERLARHLDEDDANMPRNLLRLVLPYELGLSLVAAMNAACARRRTFSEGSKPPEGTEETEETKKTKETSRRSGQSAAYWRGLMHLLLDYARTWDPPRDPADPRSEHADIYERDGYRCTCPDCTSRANLQAHHLEYRSRGGSNAPSNLVTLCAYHHNHGVHDKGTLQVDGTAPGDVRYTLGKGRHARTFRADQRVPG
jgi:hypothetical protein